MSEATIAECDCECSPNPDPCQPCAAGRYEIRCRVRSGTATIVGHSELGGTPSLPPKKYRLSTLSGSLRAEEHNTPDCSSPSPSVYDCAASGAIAINDAGVASGNYWAVGRAFPGGTDPTVLNGNPLTGCVLVAAFGAGGAQTVLNTKTRESMRLTSAPTTSPPSSCCGCLSDGANSNKMADEAVERTLTNEDTEEAAMERAGAAWGPWGEGLCCTIKAARGAGVFTFVFSQAEYQIRVAGPNGTDVRVLLTFTRSGSSPYTSVFQDVAQGPNFASPEAGWTSFIIPAASGQAFCLAAHELYNP